MDNENDKTPEVVAEPVEPGELEDEDLDEDDDEENGSILGPLYLGPPFAFEGGINILPEHDGKPGSASVVQCEGCGQRFRINLLDGAIKSCPRCRETYTHCLIIARTDDEWIFEEAIDHVIVINKQYREMVAEEIAEAETESGDSEPAEIPEAEK